MFGLGKKSNPGGPGSSGLMPSLWVAQVHGNFAGDQKVIHRPLLVSRSTGHQ